jgi:hypothetical protein
MLPSWVAAGTDIDVTTAVDSVAATNERAIVVQGAAGSDNGFYPIVWLFDLTLSPPAAYMIDMREVFIDDLHADIGQYDPHDVAITPALTEFEANDQLAVLTCDFAICLFDLTNLSQMPSKLNHKGTEFDDYHREYYKQVDSVELTYDHAVVIGWVNDPVLSVPVWSVKNFGLRPSPTTSALTKILPDHDGANYMPHDLYIQRGADVAVIKIGNATTGRNLVMQNVSTTPVWNDLPGGGTPYADWGSFPFPTGQEVRFSDSVLTASVRKSGSVFDYAVTLGGQLNVPANKIVARLDLLDLSVPSFNTSFLVGHALHDTIPTDLDFSSSMGRMFVRCQAPPDEGPTPPNTPGRDVLVVDLGATTPVLEVGTATGPQIGGRGLIRDQVDSMITKRVRAFSISEYDPSIVPMPEGYFHTSTNP